MLQAFEMSLPNADLEIKTLLPIALQGLLTTDFRRA